jgi:hypothetical protein
MIRNIKPDDVIVWRSIITKMSLIYPRINMIEAITIRKATKEEIDKYIKTSDYDNRER